MMKIELLLLLGLACLWPGVASAQPETKEAPQMTVEDFIKHNPVSKRLLDKTRPDGVKFFTFTARGNRMFSVEIVNRDSEATLRTLAMITGARVVIDPEIKFLPAKTRTITFNYLDEDIFEQVSRYLVRSERIEMWKSAAGTYFFAAAPDGVAPKLSSDWNRGAQEYRPAEDWNEEWRLQREKRLNDPRHDPFVITPGVRKPVEPQPGWQKREFNGHEFYWIPAPNPAQSQQSNQ